MQSRSFGSRGSVVGQVEAVDIKCRPHGKAGDQRRIGDKAGPMRGQRQVEKGMDRTEVFFGRLYVISA
jgi:hypothetical protein